MRLRVQPEKGVVIVHLGEAPLLVDFLDLGGLCGDDFLCESQRLLCLL